MSGGSSSTTETSKGFKFGLGSLTLIIVLLLGLTFTSAEKFMVPLLAVDAVILVLMILVILTELWESSKRRLRGYSLLVRKLPWVWIIAEIALGGSGLYLTVSGTFPFEFVVPIILAIFVVLLSELVRRISAENRRQREFGFALWLLHHEMSSHLAYRDTMVTSLKRGAKLETQNGEPFLTAIPVSPLLTDAWDIFTTAGGLQTMLDYAPGKTVAFLFTYYYNVKDFNAFNTERQGCLDSPLNMSASQLGVAVRNMNAIGEAMVEKLEKDMPPLLKDMAEEIQQVLLDLRQPPLWATAIPGQAGALKAVLDKDARRYYRWRRNHGLTHAPHMSSRNRLRKNDSMNSKNGKS